MAFAKQLHKIAFATAIKEGGKTAWLAVQQCGDLL